MKRFLFIAAVVFILAGFSFALRVAEKEVAGVARVTFENYSGPYSVSESEETIKGIGLVLSRGLSSNKDRFTTENRYTIIRAFDPAVSNGFDADILSIESAASIRHINGIRLILASYLQNRYGYTAGESMVLAIFLTYYNAVNRGQLQVFQNRYKPVVMKHLTAENAGISVRYTEWPGKTRLVIPLTDDTNQFIRPLDTGEITEKKVIDELRKREDRGLPDRKQILDIKEKELQDRKSDLTSQKKDLEREKAEEQRLAEEKKKKDEEARRAREELKQKQEDQRLIDEKARRAKTEEEKKKLEEQSRAKKEEIAKKSDDLAKKEEASRKSGEELKKQQDEVKKDEAEIKKKEELIAKKDDEIKKDKAEIRKDENEMKNPEQLRQDLLKKDETIAKKEEELQKREDTIATNEAAQKAKSDELAKQEDVLKKKQLDDKVFAGKLYYLKVKNYFTDGRYQNDLFVINALNREVLLKSPLSNITGKRYDVFMDGVVVIAQERPNNPDRLVLLDRERLEPKIWGRDTIFWRSFIEIRDDSIYAIVIERENEFRLARFNDRLERAATSVITVDRDSFLAIYGDFVYVNTADKTIMVLDRLTLTNIGPVQP